MTKQEELVKKYVKLLKVEIENDDIEYAHANADKLLCALLEELGYKDVVDVYVEIDKWYA